MNQGFFKTVADICSEAWKWRKQLFRLAWFDMLKSVRGTALGWLWLFIKPGIYIGVFWFAIGIGLRADSGGGPYPYILWLASGLIPWFCMQNLIRGGANVFGKYPYLVNRLKFPQSCICIFYVISQLIVHVMIVAVFLIICLLCGVRFQIYLIQLPFLMLYMGFFFTLWALFASPISAISRDFDNLIKALVTPMFWLSGVIFNVKDVPIPWIEAVLRFDPIFFFADTYRGCTCENFWVWEKPELLITFLGVTVVMFVLAIFTYKRWYREVPDVL